MSNGAEWTLQAEKMNLHVSWLPWINLTFSPFHISAGWGLDLLAAQVQTANPILILIFIPLVNYVIYPLINSIFPLTPLRKIGIGLFITALSFVMIVCDPRLDRRRPEADDKLAIPRIRHPYAWRSDGFDYRP